MSFGWLLVLAASAFVARPPPVIFKCDCCFRDFFITNQPSPPPGMTVTSGFLVSKDLVDFVLRVLLCLLCFLSSLHFSRRAFPWKAEPVRSSLLLCPYPSLQLPVQLVHCLSKQSIPCLSVPGALAVVTTVCYLQRVPDPMLRLLERISLLWVPALWFQCLVALGFTIPEQWLVVSFSSFVWCLLIVRCGQCTEAAWDVLRYFTVSLFFFLKCVNMWNVHLKCYAKIFKKVF